MENELGRRLAWAGVVDFAIGGLATAGSYLVAGHTTAFVAVPIHDVVVRFMPAPVVAFSIVVLGELGDKIGFAFALAITTFGFGLSYWVADRIVSRPVSRTIVTALIVGIGALLLTGSLQSAFGAAVPAGAGVALATVPIHSESQSPSHVRRRTLALVGSAAGLGALSFLLGGTRQETSGRRSLSDLTDGSSNRTHTATGATTTSPNVDAGTSDGSAGTPTQTTEAQSRIRAKLQSARDSALDVEGLHGLVSDVDSFYEVDVDSVNPSVAPADWQLTVSGSVESETTLSFDDLTSFESVSQFKTLRCVGEHLNGTLLDTALWTGVPVERVLEQASPTGTYVVLHATDDYYEEFPLEALRDGLLAYGMNDTVLPRAHGRPVRALVPGHWGEVNVKWLTKIEVRDEPATGYWEKRGWHGTGPVSTVATLWTVNHLDGGRVQVGGYAYAGTRGVQTVEVSTDGGDSWAGATLSAPLPDADVWRQWAYTWKPSGRRSDVIVRAIDSTGTVQTRDSSGPYPNGATGWVRKTIQTHENT